MAHAGDDHSHHIIPLKTLLSVFGGLIVLTILTVAVAQVDLGPLNIPVAIGIAAAKATLVVMFFMALKYDKPVNTLTFVMSTVFVVVFLAITLMDTAFRGDLTNTTPTTIVQEEKRLKELEARDPGAENLKVAPADYPPGSNKGAQLP
ncbi:cytochrome C oxidase subunit IV family protein [Salisaeta longa]|uniref:cytochrome C oxidase subunit IV family protein n=1 Tax=Salisaeta longa TaxID=503170 RepID=UPI0003B5D369|nr:cytochrome C oxidase subunit IV family protein [Salisaeta longa]